MIKKLLLTALAAFVVASLAALGLRLYLTRQTAPLGQAAAEPLPNALIVYCFHGNVLCRSARRLKARRARCWTSRSLSR